MFILNSGSKATAASAKASATKKATNPQPIKRRKVLSTVPEEGDSQDLSAKKGKLCGPAEDTSLYSNSFRLQDFKPPDELMDEQAALQMSVKEWISSYQETPIEAIYQLLAAIMKVFITTPLILKLPFKISGSPIVISREAIQQESPFNIVFEELQEGVKEVTKCKIPF